MIHELRRNLVHRKNGRETMLPNKETLFEGRYVSGDLESVLVSPRDRVLDCQN